LATSKKKILSYSGLPEGHDTMEKLDYRFMAELVESLLLFFRSHQK
jgi:hypothetical protein